MSKRRRVRDAERAKDLARGGATGSDWRPDEKGVNRPSRGQSGVVAADEAGMIGPAPKRKR